MTTYAGLRFWYLHDLRQLRAKARNGASTKTERKAAQRELAKLRKERK